MNSHSDTKEIEFLKRFSGVSESQKRLIKDLAKRWPAKENDNGKEKDLDVLEKKSMARVF